MSDQSTLFGRAGRALGLNVLSTLLGRLGTMVIGIALARLLGPEEFGALCAFLCGARSGFITGQNLLLDGGAYPGTL